MPTMTPPSQAAREAAERIIALDRDPANRDLCERSYAEIVQEAIDKERAKLIRENQAMRETLLAIDLSPCGGGSCAVATGVEDMIAAAIGR